MIYKAFCSKFIINHSLYVVDMNTEEPIHNFKSDTDAIQLKNKLYSPENETVDSKHFENFENNNFGPHLGTKG